MQTFGLPRRITRGAALASRLCGKERSDEAHRRDALERWRQARADGPGRTSGRHTIRQFRTRRARNASSPSRRRSRNGSGEKRSRSRDVESLKKSWAWYVPVRVERDTISADRPSAAMSSITWTSLVNQWW